MKIEKRAFTLIELLVVIAIIAILAAILFPVFAQAKAAAKKASCLSNAKQLSLGIFMYAGDVDDTYPNTYWRPDWNFWDWTAGENLPKGWNDPAVNQNWASEIYPYVKNLPIYTCPSAPKVTGTPWSALDVSGGGNASYAYNGAVVGKSMTSVSNTANLIVLQGTGGTSRDAYMQPTIFDRSNNNCNGIDLSWMGGNHSKGDNYAFGDGHAKYVKRTGVTFAMFGVSSDVNAYGPTGGTVPNTTTLTDPDKNPNYWWSWGTCDVSALK